MTTPIVESFEKYNSRGHSVLISEFHAWRDPQTGSDVFGPVIAYAWIVAGRKVRIDDPRSKLTLRVLPDSSGFLCFEIDWKPDDCLSLDAFGNERLRLTVPTHLVGPQSSFAAEPPTSFADVSAPFINPVNGKPGEFGVRAWVEHEGMYYFKLDFRSGLFLWGREIRD